MRVIGLAGWSGAGKTMLVTRLIPCLAARGVTVSTVKHAHHAFDIDKPGKDSYLHRTAGAREVLVGSVHRWALMHERREAREPRLAEFLPHLSPVDLVLVEGFRTSPHAKLEVHRAANGKPFLYPEDPNIVALASDAMDSTPPLPHADLGATDTIVDLILQFALPLDETLRRLAAGEP